MSDDLARRTASSVGWTMVSSLASVAVLFVRSVLLARLLPVETFGVYTGAGALVSLTAVVASFGMAGAFLHRTAETVDEEEAAAVHFTVKLLFTLAWGAAMTAVALRWASGDQRTALLVLTLTQVGDELTQTPRLVLMRRVVHRRLAALQLLDALLTTAVAVGLAAAGVTLWALLATDVVSMALGVVGLMVWRPAWRVRLGWRPDTVRYYLRFGSRNFTAHVLLVAQDRVDDLYTQAALGNQALGFYSRAYMFATYPRKILANPINQVAGGAYAELKGDRPRLSATFFHTNALLVRSGFWLAGALALMAPELIVLLLGERWLPMLQAFRLMLLFTLLDPIRLTVADLFVAVGRPERVVRVRALQLVVLAVGLFTLGPRLGIAGVALAVNAMLAVGIAVLLWQARAHVDLSLRRLFLAPTAALALALPATLFALRSLLPAASLWTSLLAKGALFSLFFAAALALLDRDTLRELAAYVKAL
ncbi:MAG: oligosaccharide flippase family protein, partial [Anaerolineae bacterium]|nr:oligosaccharide flippase family protein [Anaerolineae bacterium]